MYFVHRWCVLWVLEASFCEVAVLVLDDVYNGGFLGGHVA